MNTRITSDFEWPINGQPVATWPTVAGDEPSADEDADDVPEDDEEPVEDPESAYAPA